MASLRMDHIGIVVDDMATVQAFFAALGLEPGHAGPVGGKWADRVLALDGVHADVAFMSTPDGAGRVELIKYHAPPSPEGDRNAPSNAPGVNHIAFAVDDLDAAFARVQALGAELVGEIDSFEGLFRLCYIRGPEGIVAELVER